MSFSPPGILVNDISTGGGGADYAHHTTARPPGFENLTASLRIVHDIHARSFPNASVLGLYLFLVASHQFPKLGSILVVQLKKFLIRNKKILIFKIES